MGLCRCDAGVVQLLGAVPCLFPFLFVSFFEVLCSKLEVLWAGVEFGHGDVSRVCIIGAFSFSYLSRWSGGMLCCSPLSWFL